MKSTIFKGAGVALVTPFTKDGKIDFGKIDQLVEFQIKGRIDAIIACGTTGETPSMTEGEQVAVVERVVRAAAGRVPVIAGAGSNNTEHAMRLGRMAEDAGADAILSVVPYYNRPTQKGLCKHFEMIARSIDVPLILYNVPTRTGLNMEPNTVKELAQLDNIVAVKECNLAQVGDIVRNCGPDFTVYSGNDDQVLPLLSLGGKGVISVMANIIPIDTHDMVHSFMNGDVQKGREIQLKVLELVKALFIESSPVPVKAAMNLMGMAVGECRMPLVEITPRSLDVLKTAMKNYGIKISE